MAKIERVVRIASLDDIDEALDCLLDNKRAAGRGKDHFEL